MKPRPPPEPATIVFAIGGPIVRAHVPELCERVRALLEEKAAGLVVCDVGLVEDPDAVTVDALARLQLTARRLGCRLRVRRACGELKDLLDLMGLGEVVPVVAGLQLEPRGEVEEREQSLGVEEERDPADPPP